MHLHGAETHAVNRAVKFSAKLTSQSFCTLRPDAVALALKTWRVRIVSNDFANLSQGQIISTLCDKELGQLHTGARVGMVFGDTLPHGDGCIHLTQRAERFSERHHRVAVVMFCILRDHALKNSTGVDRLVLTQQALPEVRARVDVLRVALQRGAVACLGLFEFALLKINVTELGVMMRFVEMMNLRLQLLDPFATVGAGKFKSPRDRRRIAIDEKEIPHGGKARQKKKEENPHPFLAPDGIYEHPDLERGKEQSGRRQQPARDIHAFSEDWNQHC